MPSDPISFSAQVPVVREVDVLVVGGGTAGAVAAMAAAREGASTLVAEAMGFLGGTQTGATVTPMMPNQVDGVPLNGGIDAEINLRMMRAGTSGRFSDGNEGWFDPEALKTTLEAMATEAGADRLYFTHFVEPIVEAGAVRGGVFHNKAGLVAVRAARTIDATGDADVAARAGVPMRSGDEQGEHQPLAFRFILGGVDLDALAPWFVAQGRTSLTPALRAGDVDLVTTAMVEGKSWPLEGLFQQALADGVLEREDLNYVQLFSMNGRPGELAFNNPRIRDRIDGTDPFDLTHAVVTGRAMVARYLAFFRRYVPGCARAFVSQTAPMVGVRETRRVEGEYTLTADDFFAARKFDDAVARNCYPIDLHRRKEEDSRLLELEEGQYHEIPYRCLVPVEVDGLLVVGRALSADFEAQGAVRIQSNCRAMGEAAGRAMAIGLRQGVEPRGVDGVALREHLIAHGARLEWDGHQPERHRFRLEAITGARAAGIAGPGAGEAAGDAGGARPMTTQGATR